VQIFWINLVTEGVLTLNLVMEGPTEAVTITAIRCHILRSTNGSEAGMGGRRISSLSQRVPHSRSSKARPSWPCANGSTSLTAWIAQGITTEGGLVS